MNDEIKKAQQEFEDAKNELIDILSEIVYERLLDMNEDEKISYLKKIDYTNLKGALGIAIKKNNDGICILISKTIADIAKK